MLDSFLEDLRQKEIQEQIKIKRDFSLEFDFDIQMNTRIARYIRDNFNIVEYTIHFYDSQTALGEETPLSYEERMQFNNWIDVVGPGIWGASLEGANEEAFKDMLKEIKRKYWEKKHCNNNHRWHIFLYKDLIFLHWFGRDINDYWNNDKWWIYEPKDKADMVDCLYFCYYDYENERKLK